MLFWFSTCFGFYSVHSLASFKSLVAFSSLKILLIFFFFFFFNKKNPAFILHLFHDYPFELLYPVCGRNMVNLSYRGGRVYIIK